MAGRQLGSQSIERQATSCGPADGCVCREMSGKRSELGSMHRPAPHRGNKAPWSRTSMTLRCCQVHKEINRRVETGSLSCLHSRPPPSLAHVAPPLGTATRGAQGQSRPPGAGHPPSLFSSWHGPSLLQGQGVKRLAGNWWETGWHLPPTTPPSWQDKACIQVPRGQSQGGGHCC